MPLTPRQRALLKSLAHHLKPVQRIGKEGVSAGVLGAIADTFNQRELIKVKVDGASPVSAKDAGPLLAEALPGVEHVQTIGRVVVLYRRHPEKPEIELP